MNPEPPASPAPAPAPGAGPGVVADPVAPQPRGWWRRNLWGVALLVPALALGLVGPVHDEVYQRWRHPSDPKTPVAAGAGGWVSFAGARMRLVELARVDTLTDHGGKPFPAERFTVWRARVAYDAADAEKKLGGCNVWLEDEEHRRFEDRPFEVAGAKIPSGGGCDASYVPIPPPSARPSTPSTSARPGASGSARPSATRSGGASGSARPGASGSARPTGSGSARPSASGTTRSPSPAGPAPSPSTPTRFELDYYFALPRTARPAAVWVTLATQNPKYARLVA